MLEISSVTTMVVVKVMVLETVVKLAKAVEVLDGGGGEIGGGVGRRRWWCLMLEVFDGGGRGGGGGVIILIPTETVTIQNVFSMYMRKYNGSLRLSI